MTLTVRDVKAHRITSETAFEGNFSDALKAHGIWSRHMRDQSAGVPDRYLGAGRWVELKSFPCPVRGLPAGYRLEPEQRAVMRELVKAGDRVWYLALVALDGKKFLTLQEPRDALNKELVYPIAFVRQFIPYTSEGLDKIVWKIQHGREQETPPA